MTNYEYKFSFSRTVTKGVECISCFYIWNYCSMLMTVYLELPASGLQVTTFILTADAGARRLRCMAIDRLNRHRTKSVKFLFIKSIIHLQSSPKSCSRPPADRKLNNFKKLSNFLPPSLESRQSAAYLAFRPLLLINIYFNWSFYMFAFRQVFLYCFHWRIDKLWYQQHPGDMSCVNCLSTGTNKNVAVLNNAALSGTIQYTECLGPRYKEHTLYRNSIWLLNVFSEKKKK